MDRSELLDQMKEIFSQYVEVEPSKITEDSTLAEELGLTSFAIMSLMGEFEDAFDITVDETELNGIRTVGDVMDYIISKSK